MLRPQRFFRLPWKSSSEIAGDVDRELAFHLEMRVAELMAQGIGREAAERKARDEFGDLEYTRSYCREQDRHDERSRRWTERVAEWRHALAFAVRTLWRSRGFAAISILTLGLVVGANTGIFSVVQAVLLRPPPYRDPDALIAIYEHSPAFANQRISLSAPNLADYRAQQRTLIGIASFLTRSATWKSGVADPQIVDVMRVTANLFEVLGVSAWRGRTFVAGEDSPGSNAKVVLSYGFWQRLGADTSIVGRTVTLYNQAYDVIGIMPRGFTVDGFEALWVPLDLSDDLARPSVTRKQRLYETIGRIKPGVSLEAARADLMAISGRLATDYPEANKNFVAGVVPLGEATSSRLQRPVLLLLGAAILILLIACANLANVTLSRNLSRAAELSVRAALGAGRARLAGQLLTEALVLSALGGVLGVALAGIATRALLSINPAVLGGRFDVAIDGRVLLFSAGIAIATAVLFGLAPAIAAARADLHSSIKERGRSGTGGRRSDRVRQALVMVQVGLAVMLLIGTGLLIRSFREIAGVELGFDPNRVLTAQLRVDGARYDSAAAVNLLFDGVLAEIGREPGVVAAGAAMYLPAQGKEYSTLVVEGAPEGTEPRSIAYNMVRGDYFKALRIPILEGRDYDETDRPEGPKVSLINRVAARTFFPKGDAVGKRIRIGPDPTADFTTIVGVVGDMRDAASWVPAEPTLYDNARQQTWWPSLSVVVRTAGDPAGGVSVVRRAVRTADPTLGIGRVAGLEDLIGTSLSARRFALGLASCLAGLALVLAALGIYGVLAYSVTIRTREFGVRLALGASSRSLMVLVARQGITWSLVGLAIGIGGAIAGGKLLASLLYGVTSTDLLTFLTVATGLLVVVALASVIPARRATRVDPIRSLRAD